MSRAREEGGGQDCGWWQCLVCLELRVPTGARWQVALERSLVPILVLAAMNAMASPTFMQIKSGPKCSGQLFSAESPRGFILPPPAELTAKTWDAAPGV